MTSSCWPLVQPHAGRRIPGADADGVHYLRTIDDATALNSVLSEGSSLAVVGAGWIGLEVAAGARERGVNVTVVEAAEVPLRRRSAANSVRCSPNCIATTALTCGWVRWSTRSPQPAARRPGSSWVTARPLPPMPSWSRSERHPTSGWPKRPGWLLGDGGVLVDASLRTSDPDIYAVGDIAAAEHPVFGMRIRTEHWANALKQPAVAAAGMLGKPAEYTELPYFFTDQYDLGMEYVGHAPDVRAGGVPRRRGGSRVHRVLARQ